MDWKGAEASFCAVTGLVSSHADEGIVRLRRGHDVFELSEWGRKCFFHIAHAAHE